MKQIFLMVLVTLLGLMSMSSCTKAPTFSTEELADVPATFLQKAEDNKLEDVKELLSYDVDVNTIGNDGFTAIFSGVKNIQETILSESIMDMETFYNEMTNEMLEKYNPLVTYLVSQGADINYQDTHGNTLLMYAAIYQSVDTIKLLSELGADPNIKNEHGITALMFAAGKGEHSLYLATQLLIAGADVNAINNKGETVLNIALKKGNKSLVSYLVNHQGKITVKEDNVTDNTFVVAYFGTDEEITTHLQNKAIGPVQEILDGNVTTIVVHLSENDRDEFQGLIDSEELIELPVLEQPL